MKFAALTARIVIDLMFSAAGVGGLVVMATALWTIYALPFQSSFAPLFVRRATGY